MSREFGRDKKVFWKLKRVGKEGTGASYGFRIRRETCWLIAKQ